MKRTFDGKRAGVAWLWGVGAVFIAGCAGAPKPPQRAELSPRVVGVSRSYSLSWLVKSATGVVLVDAGIDENGEAILAELAARGLSAKDVRAVLLTHGHEDHYAAVSLFPHAPVYVGVGDAGLVRGTQKAASSFGRLLGRIVPHPQPPARLQLLTSDGPLEVDGVTFGVHLVTGHTRGSATYLFEDVLFSGDSLLVNDSGQAGLAPEFFSEDNAVNRASLEKLLSLPFQHVADGHLGVHRFGPNELAQFLQVPARLTASREVP